AHLSTDAQTVGEYSVRMTSSLEVTSLKGPGQTLNRCSIHGIEPVGYKVKLLVGAAEPVGVLADSVFERFGLLAVAISGLLSGEGPFHGRDYLSQAEGFGNIVSRSTAHRLYCTINIRQRRDHNDLDSGITLANQPAEVQSRGAGHVNVSHNQIIAA